jgi:hypothetical protein
MLLPAAAAAVWQLLLSLQCLQQFLLSLLPHAVSRVLERTQLSHHGSLTLQLV